MRTSARTLLVGLIGLGFTAVVRTLVVLGVGEPATVSAAGEILIVAGSAVIILYVSYRMPPERFRTAWRLIGWGTLFFALGDITLALMAPEVSYLGPPDVFYVLYYVFMGMAVGFPSFGMRRDHEAQNAALVAVVTGAVASVFLFFGLIEPVLFEAGLSPAEAALSVIYLFADVWLLVVPAIFILMLVSQTGDRRQSLPWLYASVGFIVMAGADAGFAWMSGHGTYVGGVAVDYGWMLATIFLAVGASLALDAARSLQKDVV